MYKDCTTCHGADKLKPFPANHAGFAADSCQTCHQVAEVSATPQAGETPAAGGPKPIPHTIEGAMYQDCTTCHGADKLKPFPANHAGFAAIAARRATRSLRPAHAAERPPRETPTPAPPSRSRTRSRGHVQGMHRATAPTSSSRSRRTMPLFTADSCTTCHQPAAAPAAAEATAEPAPAAEE